MATSLISIHSNRHKYIMELLSQIKLQNLKLHYIITRINLVEQATYINRQMWLCL